jgi:hypothetical protein
MSDCRRNFVGSPREIAPQRRRPLRNGHSRWRGSAKVNNKKGFCFEVFVRDDGEPGTTDRFRIRIWANADAASDGEVCAADGLEFFDSGDQILRGGNIQLHPTHP